MKLNEKSNTSSCAGENSVSGKGKVRISIKVPMLY